MRFSFSPTLACAAVLSATLTLSACGGGGGSNVAVGSPAALTITDTALGTGAQAVVGSRVQVNYAGWLYDAGAAGFKGRQFDASAAGKPLTFVVGAVGTSDAVITGFSQGVEGMKVGGKRTVLIPAGLAYGAAGSPPTIPGSSGLTFEVELVKVCADAACT